MAFKVFYAWQSDRPSSVCRGLIRKALDDAAAKLNVDIEDADRQVEIDQDTQGLPGSPAIADAIFDKIRECQVFVADLTLVSGSDDSRPAPNPNVLVEYGYALHARGDQRVVAVFNEAFGTADHLPFDLRHRRWPIRFRADTGDSEESQQQRREAREVLSKDLFAAIGTVIRNFADEEVVPLSSASPGAAGSGTSPNGGGDVTGTEPLLQETRAAPSRNPASRDRWDDLAEQLVASIGAVLRSFADQEEVPAISGRSGGGEPEPAQYVNYEGGGGVAIAPAYAVRTAATDRHPWEDGVVGVRESRSRDEPGAEVHLLGGPSIVLQLGSIEGGQALSNVETMEVVRSALEPLASRRSSGWGFVRNRAGAAAFTASDERPDIATTASLLSRTREFYGVDCYHLQVPQSRGGEAEPYIPTGAVEEILIAGLENFLMVASDHLDLKAPLHGSVALEGVAGYRLAIDPLYFTGNEFAGHIFHGSIGHSFTIDDYGVDAFDILLPFFEKIYDEAGLTRPAVRTVGRA